MVEKCKNHPLRSGKRRCYQCKDYFCSECVSISFHHFFCGITCKTKFIIGEMSRTLGLSSSSPGGKRGQKRSNLIPALIILSVLLIALTTVNTVLINKLRTSLGELSNRVEQLEKELQNAIAVIPEEIPEDIPVITTELPANTGIGSLSVSGSGGSGFLVTAYINDRLFQSVLPENSEFSIPGIPLQNGSNRLRITAAGPDAKVRTITDSVIEYTSPGVARLAVNTNRGSTKEPLIALTFDGGSDASQADNILRILKENEVRATFFLTGSFIRRYPEIAQSLKAGGHEVGNHTFSHPHLTTFESNMRHDTIDSVTREEVHSELSRADSMFQVAAGVPFDRYWRAPYGEQNGEIRTWAAELGYRHIGWTRGSANGENMDTRDWVSDENSDLYMTAEEIRDMLLNFGENDPNGANGSIVLMHLGSTRTGDFLYEELPGIIAGFRDKGYRLCTISELLAAAK